jgi:MFS family permease
VTPQKVYKQQAHHKQRNGWDDILTQVTAYASVYKLCKHPEAHHIMPNTIISLQNPKLDTAYSPKSVQIIVVSISICFLLYKYALQIFPSVITQQLMQEYSLSGAGLGNLAACYFYAYLVTQLFAGPLLDRFSIKAIASPAIALATLGTILFASAHLLSSLVIGRLLMGAGSAFATVCYMKMTTQYFSPHQFGRIGGMLTLGVMLGALFGEAPLAYLIQQTNWREGVLVIGIIGLVLTIGYFLFPKTSSQAIDTKTNKVDKAAISKIICSQRNWLLLLYSGLAFAPLAVFGGLWGTPFLKTAYGMTTLHASSLVSLVYLGFGIGGPLFGFFADRSQQYYKAMQLGLILALLCLCPIIYFQISSHWLLDSLLIGFGLGTGAFMLGFTVAKSTNPLFLAATIVAFINTGDAFFGAITEPLIGKLLDINHSHQVTSTTTLFTLSNYHIAFAILPLYLCLAWLFLSVVSNKRHAPPV